MNRKLIGIGIIASLAILITLTIMFVEPITITPPKKQESFEGWNRSGPFAINKFEYKMGENIFFVADNLALNDAGSAIFVLPNGTTKYISLPFDGAQKSSFNYYFKPSISKNRNICTVDDLIGEWTIIFDGTKYQELKFKILNDTLESETGNFQRVC
ncbi:MAG: hypothetical protein EB150_09680 [Nitrososphaeria archaeon]|nr:hypothetical protein [Nitrososphaeria archaeon]NDB63502.1 hypothetical protein [Nitrosopumilaceae archaeon]NDF27838.1 hypothetical protein [Nitrosopumilaceae archaeon]NDF30444.1 hypothetical protein [Nitrososphaeria archaeon]NDF47533.1 hypothetical protein [Nitrosopumilaceae archaeon]